MQWQGHMSKSRVSLVRAELGHKNTWLDSYSSSQHIPHVPCSIWLSLENILKLVAAIKLSTLGNLTEEAPGSCLVNSVALISPRACFLWAVIVWAWPNQPGEWETSVRAGFCLEDSKTAFQTFPLIQGSQGQVTPLFSSSPLHCGSDLWHMLLINPVLLCLCVYTREIPD